MYKDDGLGDFRSLSGLEIERLRKGVMKILKECGLSITTETKQKAVDFLDIQLYLLKTIYGTYRRPNDDPMNKNITTIHPASKSKYQDQSTMYIKHVFQHKLKRFLTSVYQKP